jgi:hypothetical protein
MVTMKQSGGSHVTLLECWLQRFDIQRVSSTLLGLVPLVLLDLVRLSWAAELLDNVAGTLVLIL